MAWIMKYSLHTNNEHVKSWTCEIDQTCREKVNFNSTHSSEKEHIQLVYQASFISVPNKGKK